MNIRTETCFAKRRINWGLKIIYGAIYILLAAFLLAISLKTMQSTIAFSTSLFVRVCCTQDKHKFRILILFWNDYILKIKLQAVINALLLIGYPRLFRRTAISSMYFFASSILFSFRHNSNSSLKTVCFFSSNPSLSLSFIFSSTYL